MGKSGYRQASTGEALMGGWRETLERGGMHGKSE